MKTNEQKSFFKSGLYVWLLAIVVFSAWFYDLTEIAFVIFGLFILAGAVSEKDMTCAFPIVIFAVFSVSNLDRFVSPKDWTVFIIFFVVLFASIIINAVKNKNKFKFDIKTLGLLLLVIGAALGGIRNEWFQSQFYLIGIGLYALVLIVYVILSSFANKVSYRFVAMIFTALSLILVAQTFTFYLRQDDFIHSLIIKSLQVGWGISNSIALILLFSAPFSLFLSSKSRHPFIYILIFFLSLTTVFLTQSRGGMVVATFAAIPLAIASIIMAKHRQKVVTTYAILFIIATVYIVSILDDILPVLERIFDQGMSDSGRFKLWIEGFDNWLKIDFWFGSGFSFGGNLDMPKESVFKLYHCTILQFASNFGFIGLIAFLFHIATRYLPLLYKMDKFKFVAFAGMALCGVYGMIDVTYVAPYFLLPMVAMLSINYKSDECKELKIDTK